MHLWDDQRGYMAFPYKRYAYAKATKGEALSIYGDRLTKIYKFKKDDSNLFESDVPETTRALVDLYTDSDEPSTGHVILTYDIEVEMESGLPDPLKGENEITAIGLHDNASNHYWVLVLDKAGEMKEIEREGMTVLPFADERDMLKTYLNIYEEINPTIVTGWNSDYFDTPFLYNRIRNLLGEDMANRLSPIGEVFFSPYRNRFFIAGVSYLDYLTLYKKFTYSELDNYRLDTVGLIELGEGKVEYDGSLDDLYRENVDKFIEYNLVDVQLVVKLERKLQFIDLARGICHAGRVPYEDFVYSSKYLEGAILAYLKQKGLVAPNKPADRQERMDALKENKQDKFIGAFVKDPIVGKYDWIYDLDLTSLYPSIIMTLNISPETKVAKVDGWDAEEYLKGRGSNYYINGEELTRDNLQKMLDENDYSISSNGVLYRQDVVGCIPDILDLWFSRRSEFRKLERQFGDEGDEAKYAFYKKRQLVQKILLNSLYGVLGLPAWRFYDVDNAEAVTTSGRVIIQSTASMGNLKYNKELGGIPIEVKMESGKTFDVWPNTKFDVTRDGTAMELAGSELKAGDVLNDDVTIQKLTERKNKIPLDENGHLDHNIYIDTDSVFFSAAPILNHRHQGWKDMDDQKVAGLANNIAEEMQDYLNAFYDHLAKRVFNLDTHRFEVKKEFISKSGLWIAKKRYAQWIISDNGVAVDRLDVKGLDVVRSSFPKAFRKMMSTVLIDILKGKDKKYVTGIISDFRTKLPQLGISDIAKNSSVKGLKKYAPKEKTMFKFNKSTPAHVKAAIAYNQMLIHFNAAYKYSPFTDGDKLKWVYLKNNPFGLDGLGFSGYRDPDEVINFIETYIDYDKIFERELLNKLQDFYNTLEWGEVINSQDVASEFFDFG